MKKLIIAFITIMLLFPTFSVYAGSTTLTFTRNRQQFLVRTQDAYLPHRSITELELSSPQSMVMGPDDLLYIADTGNRRIVVFNTRTNEVDNIFEYEHFQSPRGVFVTPNNILYVADATASAIFIFDALTGEYMQTHLAPQAMAFADTQFSPNRIAVDLRGNMYIIGEGVVDGIIQLSSGGEFLGFFASNRTTLTFFQLLQNIFFTERQMEGLVDRLPNTFSNLTVDSRGVVFSVSFTSMRGRRGSMNSLQRHDMAGRNTFSDMTLTIANVVDVAVDANGFIFVATTLGWIAVLSNTGEYLFEFGSATMANQDIAGWFRALQSIAVASNGDLWTLDSTSNFLQSFTQTEYTKTVFEAMVLFNQGLYHESGEVWGQVLRHNQMSVIAHVGQGRSHFYQQEFETAMNSFYLAGDVDYFSTAFWEVRNAWLMKNVYIFLIIAFVFFASLSLIKHLDRKKVIAGVAEKYRLKIMNQAYLASSMFAFSIARHPLDSYHDLKLKNKGTILGATIHFMLFFFAYMAWQVNRGFIVQTINIFQIDYFTIIGGFFGAFFLFIVSNYLVTSINDGEGDIADIFKLVSYGLFPMTIAFFTATILSHVLTLNEVFLIDFTFTFGGIYTVSIIWLGLQEVHGYSFGQTLKSLLITFFFMIVALVVLFTMFILFNEIRIFFESIIMEVYVNVTGIV